MKVDDSNDAPSAGPPVGSGETSAGREDRGTGNRTSALFQIILAAALFVFIQAFELLSPILLSLLLILLVSLAVNPVMARMRVWMGGRKKAATILALVVIVVIGLTGWGFLVPMKDSVTKFAQKVPGYWEGLQRPLIKLEQQAVSSEKKLQAEVTTEIAKEKATEGEPDAEPAPEPPAPNRGLQREERPERTSAPVRSGLGQMFEGVAGRFTAVAFDAAQIMIVLVTVFFGVVYTLMNPRPIFGALFSMVPGRHHDQALTIMRRIGEFVPRWAGATLLGMVTIGLLVFLVMWLFFGFADALVLGLIAGILTAIPFLGPMLSAVPALLLAFAKGGMTPVWVIVAYMGIQAIENNVVVPYVMARGMKLHPLAVILSMLLCVVAFGVLGVLVAAPLVAIVNILHEELYRKRFLPGVTDADLDRLSRECLHEDWSVKK